MNSDLEKFLYQFLPYESLEYHSRRQAEELVHRIATNIELVREFRYRHYNRKHAKPFEGSVSGNTFKIKRIINYRNSFIPIVIGQVFSGPTGARVQVKMRMHILVIVFLFVFFGSILSFAQIINTTPTEADDMLFGLNPVLFPYAIFIIAYTAITLIFKVESKKAKRFIEDLIR